jgi:plasmid rolling circle replication initiator protein Rep
MPRRANAKAGEPVPKGHHDPLDKFSRHRRLNGAIARELYRSSDTIDVGRRIANCAQVLGLELYEDEDGIDAQVRAMRTCNARLCPFCEWRRTRAWRKRLFTGLEAFQAEEPRHVPIFLTLTVPNPPMEDLRATLKEMNAAWNRFTSSKAFPTTTWFRRTEVTVGSVSPFEVPSPHPHFHALLMVPPKYFGRGYITHDEWRKRWTKAMRSDVPLIVDVRRVKDARAQGEASANGKEQKQSKGKASKNTSKKNETLNKSAVLEVAKYMAKGTQLIEMGDQLAEFHRQMGGLRLYAVSKSLRRFISEGLISDEEMMDANEHLAEGRLPDAKAIASWFEDTQEYCFTDLY